MLFGDINWWLSWRSQPVPVAIAVLLWASWEFNDPADKNALTSPRISITSDG
jgi:hypothetical protein